MKRWPGLLMLLCAGLAGAQEARTTPDGAYVHDPRSRLYWPRCVEGMNWNGQTCTGTPRLMTYTEAQALAVARSKAEGVAWRLPRLTELRRWTGPEGRTFFPGAPDGWLWTSTVRIETQQSNIYNYGNVEQGSSASQELLGVKQGWALQMQTGQGRGDVSRKTALLVRLVRPQP